MTTMKQDPLILGVVLIVAAMLYSKQVKAQGVIGGNKPLGTGSMPGSVGTGTNQVIGGAIGSFFQSLGFGRVASDQADPISGLTNGQQAQVDFRRGEILQENAGYTTNWETGLTNPEQAQIDFRRSEILDMNADSTYMGFDGLGF